MRRRIAHIVNPVIIPPSSDLYAAQPITFETMRAARRMAQDTMEIGLFSAQYPEDRAWVPEDFHATPDLERSVLDVGDFKIPVKFPLIKDILDRLYEASDAEYFIYTNVDIGLMPHFYLAVNHWIEKGVDAMVINRRTLPERAWRTEDLPLLYSLPGVSHPGHDCFVFRRQAYCGFELGTACLGINRIGKVLMANLMCHSALFREIRDAHLTFHIGDRRPRWVVSGSSSVEGNPDYLDYTLHNENELRRILKGFEAEGRIQAHPFLVKLLGELEKNGRPWKILTALFRR